MWNVQINLKLTKLKIFAYKKTLSKLKILGFSGVLTFTTFSSIAQKSDSTFIDSLIKENELSKEQIANISKELSNLVQQLQNQQTSEYNKFLKIAYYLDAVITTTSSLQALILKENYRNKIASLNNPVNTDLGFSLQAEIQIALKPIVQKLKKTSKDKFSTVIGSIMETAKRNTNSLFPAGNIFSTLLGLVGNLSISEKGITQEDLDQFVKKIEIYFSQYEKLNVANRSFNSELTKLITKLNKLKEKNRVLLQDLITSLNKNVKRAQLASISSEDLILQYFEIKKIEAILKSEKSKSITFPTDAIKSCKEIMVDINEIYNEYVTIYTQNFNEIKGILVSTRSLGSSINTLQLNKTLIEVEALYTESRSLDKDNLRLKTLQERLEQIL